MPGNDSPHIYYRRLRTYKYQLTEDYAILIDIKDHQVETPFLKLTPGGDLTIKARYAWDGPSGPTIDTKNFMRSSLVHDALYQLIRENHIEPKYREYADALLEDLCRIDGMSAFRAWYVHLAVRWFGGPSAKPDKEKYQKVICCP